MSGDIFLFKGMTPRPYLSHPTILNARPTAVDSTVQCRTPYAPPYTAATRHWEFAVIYVSPEEVIPTKYRT